MMPIIEIAALVLILLNILFAIWRQKKIATMQAKLYQKITIQVSQDYINKLSEVEGKILREVAKNQKIQLELSVKVKKLSDEVDSIQRTQIDKLTKLSQKIIIMETRINEMTSLIKKLKK